MVELTHPEPSDDNSPAAEQLEQVLPEDAGILSIDEVLALDLFADCREEMKKELTKRYLREMKSASYVGVPWEKQPPVWLRKFKAGDLICEEGDFDQTGFYILDGRVKVYIAAQRGRMQSDERKGLGVLSFLSRYAAKFVATSEETDEDTDSTRTIPIDAPVDLDMQNPVAELKAANFFGEMTCLNNYPRSATVVALEDCTCLEMLAPVLRLLKQKSKRFTEDYRNRALDTHLRNIPMFQDDFESIYKFLKEKIEFVDISPLDKKTAEIIFNEGDEADGFYLIRNGHVRVTKQVAGGEVVLRYLGRGEYFGEIGLLEANPRTATCSALDTVELVRINSGDFHTLVDRFPSVKKRLEQTRKDRLSDDKAMVERQSSYHLDDFLGKGLMDAQNLLLLDLEKCTRCDECVRACADAHDGITRLNRVGERTGKYLVATSCRSCSDPLCMTECPVGSIRRHDDMEIIIEDWCVGCGKCAQNCPYGNINMHDVSPINLKELEAEGNKKKKAGMTQQKAVTCDLCTNISGGPRCVYACPHDAAHRVRRSEFPTYFPNIFGKEFETPASKEVGKS